MCCRYPGRGEDGGIELQGLDEGKETLTRVQVWVKTQSMREQISAIWPFAGI